MQWTGMKLQQIDKIEALTSGPRNRMAIDAIHVNLKKFLGYDYHLGEINPKPFTADEISIRKKFGQVHTPTWTADLMTELLDLAPEQSVLDPCFGNGAFLIAVNKKVRKMKTNAATSIVGIEIDPVLFARGTVNFVKAGGDTVNCLYNGNMFDWKGKKFDAVIMNPPYIRQEELSKSGDKQTIMLKASESLRNVPVNARSNLYSYFIMHLTEFLNESGVMSIIISKAWLDSWYGNSLQEFLLKNYDIQYVIDFDTDTFPSVLIEDCILVMRKNQGIAKRSNTRFVHIKKTCDIEMLAKKLDAGNSDSDVLRIVRVDRRTLEHDSKWGKFLHVSSRILPILTNEKMVPLSQLADVARGTTTFWNKFFVCPDLSSKPIHIDDGFYVPILNSPKDLRGFNTSIQPNISYMLLFNDAMNDANAAKTIKRQIQHIASTGKTLPHAIHNLISSDFDPSRVSLKEKSGPIIFSYIIRRSKKFILNDAEYAVRDNFYAITPKPWIDKILLFGILNSSVVKLCLETAGRRHGNGVLKIQAYELKSMRIPNVDLMETSAKEAIARKAEELSRCIFNDRRVDNLVASIDEHIHAFLDERLRLTEITAEEKALVENRLQRSRPPLGTR